MSDLKTIIRDLVAGNRIMAHENIVDAYGHISVRHPDNPNRYLLSRARSPELVEEADIMEFDLDGTPVDRQNRPIYIERPIHGGIYKARPEVRAVVHAHPKWTTFLTMTGHSYQPVYAQGSLVYPMPLLDSPNSINNPVMAGRLAETLGDRPAAMMKAHGAVTVGKDIVEAFVLANYMEENAYRQYMALQIGKPYVFSEDEIAQCREKLWTETLFKRTWDHFSAKLS